MVGKFLNCTRSDCSGVAVRQGADSRSKNIKYKCRKCGHVFSISRRDFEFGRHTFMLNDLNDLRSELK